MEETEYDGIEAHAPQGDPSTVSPEPATSVDEEDSWGAFLQKHLLLVGVSLSVVGIIFFGAANWGQLNYPIRMLLVVVPLIASVVVGGPLGSASLGGRTAIMAAGLLIGPALALYGQHYQTGADPWQLFIGWALLLVPFAALARFAGLWLLWLVLVELTAGLWMSLYFRIDPEMWGGAVFSIGSAALFGGALALYEVGHGKSWSGFGARWPSRVCAAAVLLFLAPMTTVTLVSVTEKKWEPNPPAMFVLVITVLVCVTYVVIFRPRHRDFLIVTLGLSGLFAMTATLSTGLCLEHIHTLWAIFVSGAAIVVEVAALAFLLRHLRPADKETQ